MTREAPESGAHVGLSREDYSDPRVFESERSLIGRIAFVYAGPVASFAREGDYRRVDAFSDPLIVARSRQSIVALVNVCQHRGHPVVCSSSGSAAKFVCPYHGWTYRLDGSLVPTGGRDTLDGLHRGEAIVLGDVVLARPTPSSSFDCDNELARVWLDGCEGDVHVAHEETWRIRSNWKLFIENFDECYHCPWIHEEYSRLVPHALAEAFPGSRHETNWNRANAQWLERAAQVGRFTGSREPDDASDVWYGRYPLWSRDDSITTTGKLEGVPLVHEDRLDGGFSSIRISPFVHILLYPDYVFIVSIRPLAPEATQVQTTWLTSTRTSPSTARERMVPVWLRIMREDIAAIEAQQENVYSTAYPTPRYMAEEDYAFRFASWYRLRMTSQQRPSR